MGSMIGHRKGYNGVGVVRDQHHHQTCTLQTIMAFSSQLHHHNSSILVENNHMLWFKNVSLIIILHNYCNSL